jgi:hypothetical protein
MPRCTAINRLGEPCRAARMRGTAGQPASAIAVCCTASAVDRCRPFRRSGPS